MHTILTYFQPQICRWLVVSRGNTVEESYHRCPGHTAEEWVVDSDS